MPQAAYCAHLLNLELFQQQRILVPVILDTMIHFNHYVMNVTIHVKIVKALVAVIA